MKTITIVLSSDDRYAMLLGVTLCSIFENKKDHYSIDIYVIDSKISVENKERLKKLEEKYNFSINYVLPDEQFFKHIPLKDLSRGYPVPMENYYRLSVGRFLPASCHKVVNLDVDVVVRGDIVEFFDIDLEGNTIGAVPECYPSCEAKRDYLKKLCADVGGPNVPSEQSYFNSGILLIDLDLWRKNDVENRLLRFINENASKLRYHDQDALNVVLLNSYKEISQKYNLITAQDNVWDCPNPLLVHFAGGAKPWYFFSALPYRSEYVYYINKTPWKNMKYRKFMDIYFAKKFHIYKITWIIWGTYKRLKNFIKNPSKN